MDAAEKKWRFHPQIHDNTLIFNIFQDMKYLSLKLISCPEKGIGRNDLYLTFLFN